MKRVLLALVLTACATPSPTVMCTQITEACPATPPSYATDVAPLVQARCVVCHYPGTPIAPTDLSTYALVRREGGTMLGEIQSCIMPPPDAGVLSDEERTTLVEWLRCGAPNN